MAKSKKNYTQRDRAWRSMGVPGNRRFTKPWVIMTSGAAPSTVTPWLSELRRLGYVSDTGDTDLRGHIIFRLDYNTGPVAPKLIGGGNQGVVDTIVLADKSIVIRAIRPKEKIGKVVEQLNTKLMTAQQIKRDLAEFRTVVKESGPSVVARVINVSKTTISQLYAGKYNAWPGHVLAKFKEVYGAELVDCPVLGKINRQRCALERSRKSITSPQDFKLKQALGRCPNNPENAGKQNGNA